MASITPILAGHCTHPACMALKGAGLQSRCFPSRAYVIHTKNGAYVWDTGYASHFMDAARGIYKLYAWVTPVYFDTNQAARQQLSSLGFAENDIRAVIVSHFHADHIAGLRDFGNTPVICSAAAWQSIKNLRGFAALKKAFLPHLIPNQIEAKLSFVEQHPIVGLPTNLLPFTQAWDTTGTGEMLIVNLPGHAAGQIGAFVQTDNGWVLLAADAAWSPESYQNLRGPSELSFIIQNNRKTYYETLHKLNALYLRGEVSIHLTHEEVKNNVSEHSLSS
jgi:glyoxylase-like metal-dependent hydrolase (beta-lactamase superfamily II)